MKVIVFICVVVLDLLQSLYEFKLLLVPCWVFHAFTDNVNFLTITPDYG